MFNRKRFELNYQRCSREHIGDEHRWKNLNFIQQLDFKKSVNYHLGSPDSHSLEEGSRRGYFSNIICSSDKAIKLIEQNLLDRTDSSGLHIPADEQQS